MSSSGRIFTNFPRWRDSIPFSVVEVSKDNDSYVPYPNKEMNSWTASEKLDNTKFVSVQSVVAHQDKLYVLDTRNPKFEGILDLPRIFVFDLSSNTLEKTIVIDSNAVKPKSYINDLRVDDAKNKIYLTDSGEAGLVIVDLKTDQSTRILDGDPSTTAEVDHLTIDGKDWNRSIHSDGIALDTKNNILYYYALSGYSLYAIETKYLDANIANDSITSAVKMIRKTGAPDGMIMDDKGIIYLADLENHAITYVTSNGELKTLVKDEQIKWADTFSIYDSYLYFTNSRINEIDGSIKNISFAVDRVKLPETE